MGITNTSNLPPEVIVLRAMANPDKDIEQMEAEGQRELCASAALPVDANAECVSTLQQRGVQFGDPLPDDRIFRSAALPVGWKIEPTDHSMWSELRDETGAIVARIFYKAAFYDRSAFMRLA